MKKPIQQISTCTKYINGIICVTLLFAMILSACQPQSTETEPIDDPIGLSTSTATATPTPKVLTICSAEEPASLYLYDGSEATGKWNILEAIYDGPIDRVEGELQPVILESIPTVDNGGLTLETVVVKPGQEVVNANGQLKVLQKGIFVRPAGCHESACAVTWDGGSEFSMDVMVLHFKLLEGLRWSDGTPLSAADSVFSYQLATDPVTPSSNWATDRTMLYEAVDETTLVWRGLPGLTTSAVERFFWSPLPQHAMEGISASELLTNESASRHPMGWGAWQIQDWQVGEAIHLAKNPHYFRASGGLPAFDLLTFRFMTGADEALNALQQGGCDMLDSSYGLEGQLDALDALSQNGELSYSVRVTHQWQGLTFGIKPASYDDGYNQVYGDRADFFSDVRVRQAFAYCIDRQRIVDDVLGGESRVPDGLIQDMAVEGLDYPYSPAIGVNLLKEVGWRDLDNNPATPLTSLEVANMAVGTPFSINLYTGPSPFDQQAAESIVVYMKGCGVEVTHVSLPLKQLYASGPDGVLFGRQFDLALFAWGGEGLDLCSAYQSWSIPAQENGWIGANPGGYQAEVLDRACNDALFSYADDQPYRKALQTVYLEELPSIPLAYIHQVIALRKGLTLPTDANTGKSDWFWIELLNDGGNES